MCPLCPHIKQTLFLHLEGALGIDIDPFFTLLFDLNLSLREMTGNSMFVVTRYFKYSSMSKKLGKLVL